MPIYVFRCHSCDHEFERFVRSSASVTAPSCPDCGSEETVRRPAAFATRSITSNSANCAPSGGG